MDKITVLKIIDLLRQHIKELNELPGNPIGRNQTITELNMVISELVKLISGK